MSFYVSIDAGLVKVDRYIARLALIPGQRKDSNISLIPKGIVVHTLQYHRSQKQSSSIFYHSNPPSLHGLIRQNTLRLWVKGVY